MNLGEMIKQVNIDTDEVFNPQDIRDWINRGIDDISPIARKKERKIAVLNPSQAYEIPADCREIIHVFAAGRELQRVPEFDRESKGYWTWGNELFTQKGPLEGEIELFYHRNLKRLTNDNEEPEIEPEFHDLLILYAVAMSQYMDDEMQRHSGAFQRYQQRKQEYEQLVKRKEDYPMTIRVEY